MTRSGAPRQPEQTRPRLELVWPGKDQFLLTPSDDNGKPVWVEPDHPAASEVRISDLTGAYGQVSDSDPYADNLLFTGDSLDVLRILTEVPEYRRHYRGKVKLIYIDPPFNTGQTFTHYDDWMEHSTWLSFMRDRLLMMKELLAPDGSIWVHLDDAEQHRMRCLLDEVFGPGSFLTTVVWQKADSPRNDARFFSSDHDMILVYARERSSASLNRSPRTEALNARYKNPDNDPRGPWMPSDFAAARGSEKMRYPIVNPAGRTVLPPEGTFWRFTEARFRELLADNRIAWKRAGDSIPYYKRFLVDVGDMVPRTWWSNDEVSHNRAAKREIRALFPDGAPFSTPKPERLLERVIHIASNPGDVVVDVFGGSGTTAAVAHKMGRRWVTAEILPDTVAAFTEPRLRKVVDGEQGGISETVGWTGGGGFRTVTVGPSMYESTVFGVLLADWATNGRFSRAVAGQLGFTFQADAAPFCGQRGRMRLAVLDGAVGPQEVREIVGALADRERVTIVAKMVLPDAERVLKELSPGSRVRKAPRDVLNARRRRRTVSPPADTVEQTSVEERGGDA